MLAFSLLSLAVGDVVTPFITNAPAGGQWPVAFRNPPACLDAKQHLAASPRPCSVQSLQRYETQIERSLHQALAEQRQLQQE